MVLKRSATSNPDRRWLLALVHITALAPLALLLWEWAGGRLSFNPIREITLRTGRYALIALMPAFLIANVPFSTQTG